MSLMILLAVEALSFILINEGSDIAIVVFWLNYIDMYLEEINYCLAEKAPVIVDI